MKAKFKEHKDMNIRHQQMSDIIHQIAEQSFAQTWDAMAHHLNKFTPMTGDEGLSMVSSLAAQITARFIKYMHSQIASSDDTGYSIQDIQEVIFNAVCLQLDTKHEFKKEKVNLGEIKRINVK